MTVAVKVVEHCALPGGTMELRECAMAQSIVHPNIVATYKIRTVCLATDKGATLMAPMLPPGASAVGEAKPCCVGSASGPSGDGAFQADSDDPCNGVPNCQMETWMLLVRARARRDAACLRLLRRRMHAACLACTTILAHGLRNGPLRSALTSWVRRCALIGESAKPAPRPDAWCTAAGVLRPRQPGPRSQQRPVPPPHRLARPGAPPLPTALPCTPARAGLQRIHTAACSCRHQPLRCRPLFVAPAPARAWRAPGAATGVADAAGVARAGRHAALPDRHRGGHGVPAQPGRHPRRPQGRQLPAQVHRLRPARLHRQGAAPSCCMHPAHVGRLPVCLKGRALLVLPAGGAHQGQGIVMPGLQPATCQAARVMFSALRCLRSQAVSDERVAARSCATWASATCSPTARTS